MAGGANGKPSKALVTGGAGFLGSHVADRLVERGVGVVVLDDLSGGFRRNVAPDRELVRGSIEDDELVRRLFAEHRFEHVYHLAAYAAEGLSHFIRRRNYQTNLIGSVNLINAAVRTGTECFVFTSSTAVYGGGTPPFSEDSPVSPLDPYAIAKVAVEQDLRAAGDVFGLRSILFRPHNVYGERQNLLDPYRNVVGIFLRQVLSGQPCTIFGDGSQTRAFSHVSDVAPLIADCVDRPSAWGETFNVGSDEVTSVLELARLVLQASGRDVGIRRLDARHEVDHVHCSHAKAARLLGYRPRTRLADGIRDMLSWARSIELREPVGRDDIEIDRELPRIWKELMTLEARRRQ